MDLSALQQLEPHVLRAVLPVFLANYIGEPAAADASRSRIGTLVGEWSDQDCRDILTSLATLGEDVRIYEPHPAARALARTWSRDVIRSARIVGLENLDWAIQNGKVVIISNHLSYFDSTALDAALTWIDHVAADRIISVAGPKVYADTFRRIASGCLATLPVPQSNQVGQGENIPVRELARRARAALDTAEGALNAGRHLLLYAEGSRSRSGRLGPFLPATSRYIAFPGVVAVPTALVGTEHMMGIEHRTLTPGNLSVHFGAPVVVADHREPREALALVHQRVADLLPPEFRPE